MFGGVSAWGRRRAVAEVNRLPGARVLEVGVGTGLALPHYRSEKRITGIDLSAEMLDKARDRVRADRIGNIDGLLELDAEATGFGDGTFDIAVAMFVASVVPHPRRLLDEMRRVVRPGGHILFVNHFAAERGPRWWVERALAPASRKLGWHPDFAVSALFDEAERAAATLTEVPPRRAVHAGAPAELGAVWSAGLGVSGCTSGRYGMTDAPLHGRHRDRNGEVSRKHGNTLVGTLRATYGHDFAKGHSDREKLSDLLHELDEPSLAKLVRDTPNA